MDVEFLCKDLKNRERVNDVDKVLLVRKNIR